MSNYFYLRCAGITCGHNICAEITRAGCFDGIRLFWGAEVFGFFLNHQHRERLAHHQEVRVAPDDVPVHLVDLPPAVAVAVELVGYRPQEVVRDYDVGSHNSPKIIDKISIL